MSEQDERREREALFAALDAETLRLETQGLPAVHVEHQQPMVRRAMAQILARCTPHNQRTYQVVYNVRRRRNRAGWPVAWQMATTIQDAGFSKTSARIAANAILAKRYQPEPEETK